MTKSEFTFIFNEMRRKVYSEENRRKIEETLRAAQNFGDKPFDEVILQINVEIALEQSFLYELLAKLLTQP